MTSKINGTPKGVYLPISKLHSILAVPNLLAHNNVANHNLLCGSKFAIAKIKSVASKWASKHLLGVPFILLLMVPNNFRF